MQSIHVHYIASLRSNATKAYGRMVARGLNDPFKDNPFIQISQGRDCGPRMVARKSAWRLNAVNHQVCA